MTPAMTLKHACPKCGYHANENTWRGPVFKQVVYVSARMGERLHETLEFICEGCGFKTSVPCYDRNVSHGTN